jgi:hypothetical protein
MRTKNTGALLFLALALITPFSSCDVSVDSSVDPAAILVGMDISSWPSKTVYEAGESADWTGLEIAETYLDGSSRYNKIDSNPYNSNSYIYDYDIRGFDSSIIGEQTITVSKNGLSTAFTITVNPPFDPDTDLVSLSISSPPSKTVYEPGESADWTGLVVEGHYSNGSTRTETDYDISGFDSSVPGIQTIYVRKPVASGYIETSFTVTVNPSFDPDAVLVSLSVSSPPSKTVYEVGESADWTGLVVEGHYSNGSTRTETDYDISGFDSSISGVQTIYVRKPVASDYVETSFTVTVNPSFDPDAVLVSLSVSSPPDKLVYEQGDSADWAGLEVTGTYSDGSTRIETTYDTIYLDTWSIGPQSITVTKDGISAPSFTVTVRRLDALSISSPPDKLLYNTGESSDWTGLEVTATYSDGTNTEIIDYDISGFDSSSCGVKTITVSKSGNYYYYSDSFTVTVEGLVSLSVSSPPDKQVYEMDETADWTGLMIIGNYFIAGLIIEPSYEISGFDSSSSGVKTITVTKNGVSVTFTVEVLPRGSGGISILPPVQAGDINLNWSGSTVTAPGGYTGYQWFVDDMARPADTGSDDRVITLGTPAYSTGQHRVRVTAWKQGLPYSGECTITLP